MISGCGNNLISLIIPTNGVVKMTNRNVSNTCFSSKSSFNPKIYVACLASYNEGRIFGEWIDADQDPEAINEDIFNMLSKSPIANAEEYAIHDYEDFGSLHLGEYEGISTEASPELIFNAYLTMLVKLPFYIFPALFFSNQHPRNY